MKKCDKCEAQARYTVKGYLAAPDWTECKFIAEGGCPCSWCQRLGACQCYWCRVESKKVSA